MLGFFRQNRPFPDPIVKVFDIRNLRALPPVSFTAGPGFINTVPRRSSTVVVTSNRGLVNIVDASNPGDGGEFYQVRLRRQFCPCASLVIACLSWTFHPMSVQLLCLPQVYTLLSEMLRAPYIF